MKPLSFRAQQKGLALNYEILPNVPRALLGDPGRIRQVLINLVGNSIKFTEAGKILITVEDQSSDLVTTRLHISVKDTGVGIPKRNKQRSSRPFHKPMAPWLANTAAPDWDSLFVCALWN